MADANWSNVTLLLNFTDFDGGTTFLDESEDDRVVTGAGGVSIQSNNLDCDGSDDYINVANASSSTWDSTGECTFECFFSADNVTGPGTLFTTYAGVDGDFTVYLNSGKIGAQGWTTGGSLAFDIWDSGESAYISASTEYHVAVTRDASGDWRLFVDGVQKANTESESAAIADGTPITIGALDSGDRNFLDGQINALRLTNGVARYTSNFTAPSAFVADRQLFNVSCPSPLGAPEVVADAEAILLTIISSPSPLGAPAVVSDVYIPVEIAVPTPLGAPSFLTENNFSAFASGVPYKYLMRVTGTPELTIPISSWQATLQTDREQYVQCTVPAVDDYVSDLTARLNTEEIVIYRSVVVGGIDIEVEVARTSLSSMVLYEGPFRYTATLSGYSAAFSGPSTYPTKTLSGIRLVTQTVGGNVRVRSDIDWLLRPGNTVDADGLEITATYINYYSTTDGLEYMDVGTR